MGSREYRKELLLLFFKNLLDMSFEGTLQPESQVRMRSLSRHLVDCGLDLPCLLRRQL